MSSRQIRKLVILLKVTIYTHFPSSFYHQIDSWQGCLRDAQWKVFTPESFKLAVIQSQTINIYKKECVKYCRSSCDKENIYSQVSTLEEQFHLCCSLWTFLKKSARDGANRNTGKHCHLINLPNLSATTWTLSISRLFHCHNYQHVKIHWGNRKQYESKESRAPWWLIQEAFMHTLKKPSGKAIG